MPIGPVAHCNHCIANRPSSVFMAPLTLHWCVADPNWQPACAALVLKDLSSLHSKSTAARLGNKMGRLAEARLRGRRRSVEAAVEAAQAAVAEDLAAKIAIVSCNRNFCLNLCRSIVVLACLARGSSR